MLLAFVTKYSIFLNDHRSPSDTAALHKKWYILENINNTIYFRPMILAFLTKYSIFLKCSLF
jgi:hypothetical protein